MFPSALAFISDFVGRECTITYTTEDRSLRKLTLSVDLLECGRVDVRHGVQVKIEKAIKGHELRGCAIISGEAGREAVLEYTGTELTGGD